MGAKKPLAFPNKILQFLVEKTTQLQQLNQILKSVLSPDLQNACEIAAYEKGILTLVTPNGSWASRLKFEQNDILHLLRTTGRLYGLSHIKIQVAPPHIEKIKPKIKPKIKSVDPAITLVMQNCAKSISDQVLQKALIRLSKTLTL